MVRTIIGSLAVAACLFTAAHAQEQYRAYLNDRFGVRADVPRSWRAGPEPENGDGLKFTSPDGTATITVSGGFNIADTPAEAIDSEQQADDGETITYRNKNARMSVISGTRGATIFYRKALLSCKDEVVNRVSIEYPAARKAAYDPLVSHVAGSLRGSVGVQTGSCR
jgi:Tfp pilus assembly protein PilE